MNGRVLFAHSAPLAFMDQEETCLDHALPVLQVVIAAVVERPVALVPAPLLESQGFASATPLKTSSTTPTPTPALRAPSPSPTAHPALAPESPPPATPA
jgi:hypothetical protein